MAVLSLCNMNVLVLSACSAKGQGWGRHVSQVQIQALPESVFKYNSYAAIYASFCFIFGQ